MSHLAIGAAFCGLKVSQRQGKVMAMVICKDERGKQWLHPLPPLQSSHEEERGFLQKTMVAAKATEVLTA